ARARRMAAVRVIQSCWGRGTWMRSAACPAITAPAICSRAGRQLRATTSTPAGTWTLPRISPRCGGARPLGVAARSCRVDALEQRLHRRRGHEVARAAGGAVDGANADLEMGSGGDTHDAAADLGDGLAGAHRRPDRDQGRLGV